MFDPFYSIIIKRIIHKSIKQYKKKVLCIYYFTYNERNFWDNLILKGNDLILSLMKSYESNLMQQTNSTDRQKI